MLRAWRTFRKLLVSCWVLKNLGLVSGRASRAAIDTHQQESKAGRWPSLVCPWIILDLGYCQEVLTTLGEGLPAPVNNSWKCCHRPTQRHIIPNPMELTTKINHPKDEEICRTSYVGKIVECPHPLQVRSFYSIPCLQQSQRLFKSQGKGLLELTLGSSFPQGNE